MNYYDDNRLAKVSTSGMLDVRNHNMIPSLKAQRDELMNRVSKIDTLLALLEENPTFVKMLDLSRELI